MRHIFVGLSYIALRSLVVSLRLLFVSLPKWHCDCLRLFYPKARTWILTSTHCPLRLGLGESPLVTGRGRQIPRGSFCPRPPPFWQSLPVPSTPVWPLSQAEFPALHPPFPLWKPQSVWERNAWESWAQDGESQGQPDPGLGCLMLWHHIPSTPWVQPHSPEAGKKNRAHCPATEDRPSDAPGGFGINLQKQRAIWLCHKSYFYSVTPLATASPSLSGLATVSFPWPCVKICCPFCRLVHWGKETEVSAWTDEPAGRPRKRELWCQRKPVISPQRMWGQRPALHVRFGFYVSP